MACATPPILRRLMPYWLLAAATFLVAGDARADHPPHRVITEDALFTEVIQIPGFASDPPSIQLEQAPSGMQITATAAVSGCDPTRSWPCLWEATISWTPGNEDIGDRRFTVAVCRQTGPCLSRDWRLRVKNVNDAPKISSRPGSEVVVGEVFSYEVRASDPDPTRDRLTYRLIEGPPGAVLDPIQGLLRWQPASGDRGSVHKFAVQVSDEHGGRDTQAWAVSVVQPQ